VICCYVSIYYKCIHCKYINYEYIHTMGGNEIDPNSDDDSGSDSEDDGDNMTNKKINRPDDIGTCILDTIKKINYTRVGCVFILFMMVTSTTFIETILSKRKSCVSGCYPTLKGTAVQGIFLTLGFVAIDIMISSNLI